MATQMRSATSPDAILSGYTTDAVSRKQRRMLVAGLAAFAFTYGFIFALYGTFVLMQLLAPLFLVCALCVWLLPDTATPPVALLDRMLLLFVAVVVCWPNYLALALPGMPWITMIRLVAVPLAIVMLICLSTSQQFRNDMKAVLAAAPVIWKLVVAFVGIAFLSIAFSRNMGGSFSKFVVAQLYWTLIFFGAVYAFSKEGRAVAFARILWISMLVVALIGVQEWRHKVVPWAGHVPSFLKVDDETLAKMLSSAGRKATGIYRVKSVFTTALGLAEYLALCTPFLIHFAATAKRNWVRVAAIASLALTFYVISKTDSRLGVVGFFLSFIIYLLARGVLRWRNQPDSIAGPVIVITYPAIFCAFMTASFFVRRLKVMMWGGGAQQASSDARKGQIAKGIPQVLSHPWGYGIGQGAETLKFANQAGVYSIDTYYLSIGLEYGIIGFLVYYGMFAAAVALGGRAVLDAKDDETRLLVPLIISLIIFLIVKSVFSQESNHPVPFAMLGAVVALIYRVQQQRAKDPSARRLRFAIPKIGRRAA